MSNYSPAPTHFPALKAPTQTFSDAQMLAVTDQLYQTRALLSQSIDAEKQKLADLRSLKRQNDRFLARIDRKVEVMKAALQAEYGHCFDLRNKQVPWDKMTEWLAINSSGDTVAAVCLVAIRDPDTAFYFKITWM